MKRPWVTTLTSGALALLAVAGLQGWLLHQRARLVDATARAEAAREVRGRAAASAPQVAQAQALKNRMVSQTQMPVALFDFLSRAEESGQVHLIKAVFQDSSQTGGYLRLPVQLQGEVDSYAAFQNWLGRLEQFPYAGRVAAVKSGVAPNTNRVVFTLTFYLYEKP